MKIILSIGQRRLHDRFIPINDIFTVEAGREQIYANSGARELLERIGRSRFNPEYVNNKIFQGIQFVSEEIHEVELA